MDNASAATADAPDSPTIQRPLSALRAWLAGGKHSATSIWAVVDQFADIVTQRRGSHRILRFGPAWAYLAAIISWLTLLARQVPCRYATAASDPDRFGWMCYSDISSLYFSRDQAIGALPYTSAMWEYPVVTGYFAAIANAIARLFGAHPDPGVSGQQMVDNLNIYFAVTAVGLFICLLWLIRSTLRIVPGHPGVAVFVALAPATWTAGLINWDLLAIALAAAGLAAWQEQRHIRAGVWLGLGVAAKLYPVVIIGALFILAIRPDARRDWRTLVGWVKMAAASAIAWIVVNIPVMVTQFDGWSVFYTFNSDRGADFGSFWYSLSLADVGVDHPIWWSRGVMIVGYLGLACLIYFAAKPPTAIQIAYLAVAIMVVCNLVYSPQYVLWILPLIAIARPKILDLTVFTISELVYYVFVWLYLRNDDLSLGVSTSPWLYIWATWLRLAATIWVMARVVRDIWRGRHPFVPDPVPADALYPAPATASATSATAPAGVPVSVDADAE